MPEDQLYIPQIQVQTRHAVEMNGHVQVCSEQSGKRTDILDRAGDMVGRGQGRGDWWTVVIADGYVCDFPVRPEGEISRAVRGDVHELFTQDNLLTV